jgi:Raf kinase inhibitor-like YbhB/YbcL family protein
MSWRTLFITITLLALAAGFAWLPARAVEHEGGRTMAMEITSTAFANEGMIPRRFTCDGEDISPPLSWKGMPGGTKSLALIADDPDAPRKTWVHWVVYNLPASSGGLPENVPPEKTLADGGRQGTSDFGRIGYGGPCPPSGTHRYFFKLYALDSELGLAPGATKEELLQAMAGHVLAEAQLMGRYRR